MNIALLDFRQAIRNMRKNPGSTLLAVLMLAVGIGATTAIFSVFYSVLLKPLPFPEPARLVNLWESRTANQWNQATFTEANFWDVQARNRTFEGIAAYHSLTANLIGSGEPEHGGYRHRHGRSRWALTLCKQSAVQRQACGPADLWRSGTTGCGCGIAFMLRTGASRSAR
ncbi:MAG TPA: hypothetical protein VHW72_15600 [Candidatus Angelobacter sp.]|jgi:hypothetical protein|nr:hypothetical protein [Candidatus Angelobacter sp.]